MISTLNNEAAANNLDAVKDSIHSFFDSGLPEEHRKDLKKWRHHVINEKPYKDRNGSAHVFANYEETLQLIVAAHSLIGCNQSWRGFTIVTENVLLNEQKNWEYFPSNLSKKAILNPSKVIDKFFKSITLDEYKDQLHEWLHLALSSRAAHETLSPKQIIDLYHNLKKLYSAMWLIHNRLIQFGHNI